MHLIRRFLMAGVCFGVCAITSATAQTTQRFDDVTTQSRAVSPGQSYGVSLRDFDNDGHLDLYSGNHLSWFTTMLRNDGTGAFDNIVLATFNFPEMSGDKHSGTFADFDNDGDQDLFVAVGACQGACVDANKVFVRQGSRLNDQAGTVGLALPNARGRSFLLYDWNGDSRLDALLSAKVEGGVGVPTSLFLSQANGTFVNVTAGSGLPATSQYGIQIWQPTLGNVLFLQPNILLRPGTPATNLTTQVGLGSSWHVDSAWADFDNDGDLDVFGARSFSFPAFAPTNPQSLEVSLIARDSAVKMVIGQANPLADITVTLVEVGPGWTQAIRIGDKGWHPASPSFVLSPSDPAVHGVPEFLPGADSGINLGFDESEGIWILAVNALSSYRGALRVDTTSNIIRAQSIGWDNVVPPRGNEYMEWNGSTFIRRTTQAGFTSTEHATGCVAGDFDNDMDVDLYVANWHPLVNPPNDYYENLGNRTFRLHAGGSGAPGAATGVADVPAVGDLNNDGFLDLAVPNGFTEIGFPNDGELRVYRARPNGNHWLLVNLVGTTSNRDAVGSRVQVTTGSVTQLRLQNSGVHHHSQDDDRLHFGLGANTTIDTLRVTWPDGSTRVLTNVAADQILTITQ